MINVAFQSYRIILSNRAASICQSLPRSMFFNKKSPSILKYTNKATSICFKASVKDYECACCNAIIMGATEKA